MKKSELTDKRVKLVRMEDPYTDLKPGSEGTIRGEDDAGHILVNWDNGSSLNLCPDIDEYHIEGSDPDHDEDVPDTKLKHLQSFERFKTLF